MLKNETVHGLKFLPDILFPRIILFVLHKQPSYEVFQDALGYGLVALHKNGTFSNSTPFFLPIFFIQSLVFA